MKQKKTREKERERERERGRGGKECNRWRVGPMGYPQSRTYVTPLATYTRLARVSFRIRGHCNRHQPYHHRSGRGRGERVRVKMASIDVGRPVCRPFVRPLGQFSVIIALRQRSRRAKLNGVGREELSLAGKTPASTHQTISEWQRFVGIGCVGR